MKKYYLVKMFYSNKDLFSIWYANDDDADGFIVHKNRISVFKSSQEAISFAKNSGLVLEQGITTFDIIDIINIIEKIKNVMLSENCHELFDIWNIFGDIAKSTNEKFIGNSDDELTRDVYEKLFYGSNLRVITQDMEEYHPMFDEEETELCISIFRNGLDILDKQFDFF